MTIINGAENVSAVETFLKFVLLDGKKIKPEQKNLVVMPPSVDEGLKKYYQNLRSHSTIVLEFIKNQLVTKAESNKDILNNLLKNADDKDLTVFGEDSQAIEIALALLE